MHHHQLLRELLVLGRRRLPALALLGAMEMEVVVVEPWHGRLGLRIHTQLGGGGGGGGGGCRADAEHDEDAAEAKMP